jgi:hypothetical protein
MRIVGVLAANYARAGEEAQAQRVLARITDLAQPNGRAANPS